MRNKLRYLIILSVLATFGVVFFQILWLHNSYKLTKHKLTSEAKAILDEAIVEHKELVAERVRRLLKKGIHPKDIETKVLWKLRDSQYVSFGYRTKRLPNASWTSFKVLRNEVSKVQSDPYPLLLKKIDEENLDELYFIYSTFIGVVNYEPNSLEEKLQDTLMRYFYLHEDTASLNKIIKNRFKKIDQHLTTQVLHFKGIDAIYNQKLSINRRLKPHSEATIEMVQTKSTGRTLTAKLDSLSSYFVLKGNKEGKIYITKAILDDINTILLDKISIVVLIIDVPLAVILQQMLLSIVGSGLLLLLIGFCLTYMFYTILKQKKLADIKDDFISNVSHELKTPVATTLAAIQGMQHFDVLNDKIKTDQYLNTAANEMQRLSGMIDEILNSAIYERSDFNLHLSGFNFKEMLEKIIKVQEQHSKKEVNIELNYQYKEEIFADKTHLYNVFINLIDNSIKYGNENVIIKIDCLPSDEGVKILFADNGDGIPMIHQKNIFDKFFRVPNPGDHSIKGHGLGLNYVKSIVKKHNGVVQLLKSDINGSTFEVNLPQ